MSLTYLFSGLVIAVSIVVFFFVTKKRDDLINTLVAGQKVTDNNMKRVFVWLEHLVGCKEAHRQQVTCVADQLVVAVDDLRLTSVNLEGAITELDAPVASTGDQDGVPNRRTLRKPKATELPLEEKFVFKSFPPIPLPPSLPLVPVPMPKFDDSSPDLATAQTVITQPIMTKRRALIIGAVVLVTCLIGTTAYYAHRAFKPVDIEAKAAKVAQAQAMVTPLPNECSACKPDITGGVVDTEGAEPNLKYVWANSCGDAGNCSSCKPAAVCTNSSSSVISPGCATASCVKK